MRENGYYWAQFVQFGGIDLILWRDGAWHYHQDITDAELRIISGPIPLPTPEQIAGHAARLARMAQQIFDEDEADPKWDGVHIDGAYWIKRDGYGIELVRSYEGNWTSYDWSRPDDMIEIVHDFGGVAPPVLFGPVDRPVSRHHTTQFATDLRAEAAEKDRKAAEQAARQAAKPARRPRTAKPKVASMPKTSLH